METKRTCEECGATLPPNAPGGLCPRCLAGMGLNLAAAFGVPPSGGPASEPAKAACLPARQGTPNAAAELVVPVTEKPGDRIGRYKLLQKIGEGGMGVVYMAEQEEPIRRRVALKIIKLGMDTRQVVARFEAERQALALMDHPNIAKVLDAGATETVVGQASRLPPGHPAREAHDAGKMPAEAGETPAPLPLSAGRPYFVMELVPGVPITEYCDKNHLPTRQRLDLFIQVCHAIQHAHQKGIIHRDLKPTNILVTLNDGVPLPMVIDFGIAKATNQKLTEKTLFTNYGMMIGTPAYMSPEQAEMSKLDVDTRTDIYSLGVLLYELLTGTTPFPAKELLSLGYGEMQRVIAEREPLRPSTRLSTMTNEERTVVAKNRSLEASALGKLFRGDLDWIAMKCLEKDRTRRYETVNGLAMDLQRHLADEPVVARPPGNFYRFQKLVRRNKLAFAAGAALLLVLLGGIAASTWQAIRATRAEREQTRQREQAETARNNEVMERAKAEANEKRAESEAAKSQQVAQFMKDMLKGVGPSVALGRDTKLLREILDRTAERIGKDLTNQPEVEVELRAVLTLTYEELALFKQREEMARETLRVSRSRLGEEHPAVADALHQIGDARSRLGDQVEAETFLREAVALKRKVFGNEHPSTAASLNVLAWVVMRQNKLTEAEMLGREALAIRRKQFGNEHRDVADSIYLLAMVMDRQGKLAEAETMHREALAMERKLLGEEHPIVAESLDNLAVVLRRAGKLAESETMHRESLAQRRKLFSPGHPEVADSFRDLALVLRAEGKLAEVETLYREELAARRKLLGNEHPEVANALHSMGDMLRDSAKWKEAEAAFRDAVAMRRKLFGNENLNLAHSLHGLAWVLNLQGKRTEAEAVSREELAMRRKLLGNEHPDVAATLQDLTVFLRDQGKVAEAEALSREAVAVFEHLVRANPKSEPYRTELGHSQWRLADALRAAGQREQAEHILREALRVFAQAARDFPAELFLRQEEAFSRRQLGDLLSDQGQVDEAVRCYRDAIDAYVELIAAVPQNSFYREEEGYSTWMLATIFERAGRLDAAEAEYRHAIALHEKASADFPNQAVLTERLGTLKVHLVELLRRRGRISEAKTMYREAGERGSAADLNEIAWSLATDPDPKSRDGTNAVVFAEKAVAATNRKNASYLDTLAAALAETGQFAKAINIQQEAITLSHSEQEKQDLASRLRLYENNSPYRDQSLLAARASARLREGKFAEAETLLREELIRVRKLSTNAPSGELSSLGLALHHLADVLRERKALTEARSLAEEAVAMYQRHRDWPSNERQHALQVLTAVLSDLDDFAGLEALYREELARVRKLSTNDPAHEIPELGVILHHLADVRRERKALAEARSLAEEAAAMYQRHPDWPPNERQHAFGVLGDVLTDLEDFLGLEALLHEQLLSLPSEHPAMADVIAQLTTTLLREKKFAEAEPLARECLTIREKKLPNDWRTFNARSLLGGSLLGQEKYAEAEPLLLSGYEGMKQRESQNTASIKLRLEEALQRLVQLYEATGQSGRAAEWKRKLAESGKRPEK